MKILIKNIIVFILIIFLFTSCSFIKIFKKGSDKDLVKNNYNLEKIVKVSDQRGELKLEIESLKKELKLAKKKIKDIIKNPVLPLNERIVLSVKNAPLLDTFKILAEKAKISLVYDFIFDDTLNKTITAYYDNQTISKVIKSLCDNLHLMYTYKNKVLTLRDYIEMSINLPIFLFDDSAKFSSDVVSIEVNGKLGQDIKADLERIAGSKDNILINSRTGLIYFKLSPDRAKALIEYLNNLKDKLLKYLFVKMYIIKINVNLAKKYGIDFNKIGMVKKLKIKTQLSPGTPDAAATAVYLDRHSVSMILKAIEENNIGEIVSSPFLMIRNNSMAGIKIVTQVGWFEPGDVNTVTGGNTSTTVQDRPTFQTKDVGTSLSIYPKLINDRVVQLLISIKDTTLEQFITYPWQAAPDIETITLKYPLLSEREVTTQVLAETGKYIIIGGFKESKKQRSETKSPFFKKIPIIGKIFKYKDISEEAKDLYIIMSFEKI